VHILWLNRIQFLQFFYYNFVERGPFATKCCTHNATDKQHEEMLQIWLLYDFYFLVCAHIVAKPYVRLSHNIITRTHEKVDIIQSPNLQHFFQTVCSKRTTFDKVTVKKLKILMDPSSRTRYGRRQS